jgi:hypothetical protein
MLDAMPSVRSRILSIEPAVSVEIKGSTIVSD